MKTAKPALICQYCDCSDNTVETVKLPYFDRVLCVDCRRESAYWSSSDRDNRE